MSDYIDLRNQDFSFWGKTSKMSGTFFLKGSTHLASEVEGELHMEEKASLTIETSGNFKGILHCHDVAIYGHFEGTLNATGRVIIYPPAILTGKINAHSLIIHPGATVNMEGHTLH